MPLVDYSGRYVDSGAPGGGADRVADYLRYVPCAAALGPDAPGQPGPGGPSGGGPASSPGFPVFGTAYMFESATSSPAAGDAGIPVGMPAAAAGPDAIAAGGGGGTPAGGVAVHNIGPGPDALPGYGAPATTAAACSPGQLNQAAPLAKYGNWILLGLVGLGVLVAVNDSERGGGRQF